MTQPLPRLLVALACTAPVLARTAPAPGDAVVLSESVASLGGANGYVGGDFGDNNNRSGEVRVRGLGRASTTINEIEVLGYARKDTTFNFGGLTNFPGRVSDTAEEHSGDPTLSGGMFASYGRRIFGGKVGWRVQLNAQNLFGESGLRGFAANPDGSPIWAMAPARTFELSNSFDF